MPGTAKAASLLLLRSGTGLLLVLWGALRLMTPAAGPGLATKYYGGFLDVQSLQIGFGIAEVIIGLFVVLGLFRHISCALQAVILVPGALVLWRYLIDPLGLVIRDEDLWSLDHRLSARRTAA